MLALKTIAPMTRTCPAYPICSYLFFFPKQIPSCYPVACDGL